MAGCTNAPLAMTHDPAVRLYDAHVHLAAETLQEERSAILQSYAAIGLAKAVVVGTAPQDWPAVLTLCRDDPRFLPAIGLHPWEITRAPNDWQHRFLQALDQGAAVIGEIGLDRSRQAPAFELQTEAFRFQMAVATQRNLPVSIHCVRAIGALMEILRTVELPTRGFHLHAYQGPIELIGELMDRGAYFSFHSGQLRPKAKCISAVLRAVSADRLLIETDAPAGLPTAEWREFSLADGNLCHPGNLRSGYKAIAQLRGLSYGALREQIEANFLRYFN